MAITTFEGLDELRAAVGRDLGTSDWVEITQERVDTFADATGDHQWIHVDVERAAAESPFGGPIAHGYLTLALLIPMWAQVLTVTDQTMGVNYGLGKVRFPAALPVGTKVRATIQLANVEDVQGGVQITMAYTFEGEGVEKPVCVAETLARIYGG